MRLVRAAPLALSIALAVSFATTARAGDDAGARAYRSGEEAYRAKRYREAAESFESAYRADPRGASIYNAGLAWQAAGEPARAADAFATALESADLPEAFKSDAKEKLAALERSLARVDVTAPSGARVSLAHVEGIATPAHVHVAPGVHTIRVAFASGASRTKRVSAVAGSSVLVDFELPPPAAASAPAPVDRAPDPPPDKPASPAPSRTLAWIALGGAAASFGAAAYLHVATLDATSAFRDDLYSQSKHDKAVALQTGTWIALGVGVAATAAGITLLVLPSRDTDVRVGAGTVSLRARF